MKSRLHRHVFARCAESALHNLPESCLFSGERGELCVRLHACWVELLCDCADLGPVALVSQSAGAQLARCVPGVEFAPVPDSTEIVELGSGFLMDTAEWSYALAVEEPVPGGHLFSLQFFAPDGEGLWKLLLTRDAQLDQFSGMVRHYACGTPPPEPMKNSAKPASRLTELRQLGCAWAQETPREMLVTTLLAARREERELSVAVGHGGLMLTGTLTPRTLERCPCALHAYDYAAELHLATGEGFSLWRVRERAGWVQEILDATGQLSARIS